MNKILITEDNLRFKIYGAKEYFGKEDIDIEFAEDYVTAYDMIENRSGEFRGGIFKVFMRYEKDSDDISHGEETIDYMIESQESKIAPEKLEEIDRELDNNQFFRSLYHEVMRQARRCIFVDRKTEDYLKMYAYNELERSIYSPPNNLICTMIGFHDNKLSSRKGTTRFIKSTLNSKYGKDDFRYLRQNLQDRPEKQPLGVRLSDEAQKKGFRFVLTIHKDSSDLRHVKNFAKSREWRTLSWPENENIKVFGDFWENAFREMVSQ